MQGRIDPDFAKDGSNEPEHLIQLLHLSYRKTKDYKMKKLET